MKSKTYNIIYINAKTEEKLLRARDRFLSAKVHH